MGHLNERMRTYPKTMLLVQRIEKLKVLDSTRMDLVSLEGVHSKILKFGVNLELASAGYYRVYPSFLLFLGWWLFSFRKSYS